MAYYTGTVNSSGRASLSSKYGYASLTVEPKGSGTMASVSSKGKKYVLFLNKGNNGGLMGEKMFRRYAVKVVISNHGTDKAHVWVKRLGGTKNFNKSYNKFKSFKGGY